MFLTSSDWFEHATSIVKGLNLDCLHIEEIPNGYKFYFGNSIDADMFSLAASGNVTGHFQHDHSFDNEATRDFWHQAAVAHMNDRGIEAEIEMNGLKISYKFLTRADYVSFTRAANTGNIYENGKRMFHASMGFEDPSPD